MYCNLFPFFNDLNSVIVEYYCLYLILHSLQYYSNILYTSHEQLIVNSLINEISILLDG